MIIFPLLGVSLVVLEIRPGKEVAALVRRVPSMDARPRCAAPTPSANPRTGLASVSAPSTSLTEIQTPAALKLQEVSNTIPKHLYIAQNACL